MGILNKLRRKSSSLPSPKVPTTPLPSCYHTKVSAGVHDISGTQRTLTHRSSSPGHARIYDSGIHVYDIEASSPHTSATTTSVSTHGPDSRFIYTSHHRTESQRHARSKVTFLDDLDAEESQGDGVATFTASDDTLSEAVELTFTNVYTNHACSLRALRPDFWPSTLDMYFLDHDTGEPPVLVCRFERYRAAEDEVPDFKGSSIAHRVDICGNISFALVSMFVVGYIQTFDVYLAKMGAKMSRGQIIGSLQNVALMGNGLGGGGGAF